MNSETSPELFHDSPLLGRVCRLGLATRGNTRLEPEDVIAAIDRGINVLNWCGHADGMSRAVRELGARREEVKVIVQLQASDAEGVRRELDDTLDELGTDYVDGITYYYIESEWEQLIAPGGAAVAVEDGKTQGVVRAIGLTSHQRRLAGATRSGVRASRS